MFMVTGKTFSLIYFFFPGVSCISSLERKLLNYLTFYFIFISVFYWTSSFVNTLEDYLTLSTIIPLLGNDNFLKFPTFCL